MRLAVSTGMRDFGVQLFDLPHNRPFVAPPQLSPRRLVLVSGLSNFAGLIPRYAHLVAGSLIELVPFKHEFAQHDVPILGTGKRAAGEFHAWIVDFRLQPIEERAEPDSDMGIVVRTHGPDDQAKRRVWAADETVQRAPPPLSTWTYSGVWTPGTG